MLASQPADAVFHMLSDSVPVLVEYHVDANDIRVEGVDARR
jgi:hypothetical protein